MNGFTAANVPDQSGKVILITGANTGIGFQAALMLAGKGARVVLGCRDAARGEAARQHIAAAHPAAETQLLPIDLGDLDSVAAAAASVEKLDILINNAGIMTPPLGRTRQGFESQLGINHLGHFALTSLLLPKLQRQTQARVVSVSSIAHRRGAIDFANLDAKSGYSKMGFYAQSKLANLMFILELDRRLRASGSPVAAIACHPGLSGTDLGRNSALEKGLFAMAGWAFNTAEAGAYPTLQAACDPAAKSGDYYGPLGFLEMRGNSGPAQIKPHARDINVAARLWDVSASLTAIDPGLPPA